MDDSTLHDENTELKASKKWLSAKCLISTSWNWNAYFKNVNIRSSLQSFFYNLNVCVDFMSLISFHSYEGVQTNEIPLCSLFKQHTVFRSHTIHIVRWIMRIAKSIKRHALMEIMKIMYLNTRTKRIPCIFQVQRFTKWLEERV